jgi:adenylate kinase
LDQAQELQNMLNNQYRLVAISISVPDEALLLRDEGRLIFQNCGRVYHKQFSPPVHAMSCDFCRSALTQRYDDNPEKIRKKLEEHRKAIDPVVEFYRKEGILREVNGDCLLETTFEEIQKCYNACTPSDTEYAFLSN